MSSSFQVAPGKSSNRPADHRWPAPGQWYTGLTGGDFTNFNILFYGDYNHDPNDPSEVGDEPGTSEKEVFDSPSNNSKTIEKDVMYHVEHDDTLKFQVLDFESGKPYATFPISVASVLNARTSENFNDDPRNPGEVTLVFATRLTAMRSTPQLSLDDQFEDLIQ